MKITRYCTITDDSVYSDGKLILESECNKLFPDFLKDIYGHFNIDYPKFFKMDDLAKFCFVTSEILLKDLNIKTKYKPDKIGVIISNSSASISTDLDFFDTMNDKDNYYPSPSLFAYTLPNIMIAEICIRNNFKGENAFFIFNDLNCRFIYDYTEMMFSNCNVEACLLGWCDYYSDKARTFLGGKIKQNRCSLMLVENGIKESGTHELNENALQTLLG